MRIPEENKFELIQILLTPAIRFCLRHSIGIQQIIEAAKKRVVELSVESVEEQGKKASITRISVMTGLHRRDVTRLMRGESKVDSADNLIMRALAYWEQDKRFLTKGSKPRVLTWKGSDSEFNRLSGLVSKEVKPGSLLFAMEQMDLVEKTDRGLRLKEAVRWRTANPERGLNLLGRDIDALTEAVEENIFNTRDPRNLHLRTEYDNIFKEDIPKVRKWLFEEGAKFHKRARDFLSRYDKDLNIDPDKEGGARVVLGAFSITDREEEA